MPTVICEACGHGQPGDARFCGRCGSPVSAPRSEATPDREGGRRIGILIAVGVFVIVAAALVAALLRDPVADELGGVALSSPSPRPPSPGLAIRTLEPASPPPPMPAVSVPDAWVGGGDDSLTIFHPPRWYATTSRLTRIISPVDLVSVATFDLEGIPAGGGDCSQTPESAIETMGERDAFLSIIGVYNPDASPDPLPLVGRIDSWPEASQDHSMAVHCADNGELLTDYTFEFRAGRHAYRALTVFGPEVTAKDRETMLRVLNSFRPEE